MRPAGVVLVCVGTAFMVLAALGVFRLPGAVARLHGAGKGTTLGLVLTLAGTGLVLADRGYDTGKLVVAGVFLLVTTPVAAHVVARAVLGSGQDDLGRPARAGRRPPGRP